MWRTRRRNLGIEVEEVVRRIKVDFIFSPKVKVAVATLH